MTAVFNNTLFSKRFWLVILLAVSVLSVSFVETTHLHTSTHAVECDFCASGLAFDVALIEPITWDGYAAINSRIVAIKVLPATAIVLRYYSRGPPPIS